MKRSKRSKKKQQQEQQLIRDNFTRERNNNNKSKSSNNNSSSNNSNNKNNNNSNNNSNNKSNNNSSNKSVGFVPLLVGGLFVVWGEDARKEGMKKIRTYHVSIACNRNFANFLLFSSRLCSSVVGDRLDLVLRGELLNRKWSFGNKVLGVHSTVK